MAIQIIIDYLGTLFINYYKPQLQLHNKQLLNKWIMKHLIVS